MVLSVGHVEFAWSSLEEAKFMASIIYEGILESYPGLKLLMAHGGGYFPHNMGRLDRSGFEQFGYGIGRSRPGHHGKTDIRRG